MTARELVELLETHDPDKAIYVYSKDAQGAVPITGIDSYEDVLIIVRDEPTEEQ